VPPPPPSREAELSRRLEERDRQVETSNQRLAALEKENALLREKIDALVRRLFGAKSEQLDPAQLLLLLQGMEEPPGKAPEPAAEEAPRRAKAPSPPRERGPRAPEHLPVIEEVIEPERVKAAPQEWRRIGEEVSERLDYEPARFLRLRTVRPRYVRRGELDARPIVAPLPESILERGIVAPGLLAQIVVSKYCDHLPLYRQESIYWTRHRVWLPRQTLAEWVGLAAQWLQPIYREIGRDVLGQGDVQIDETPIRYLAPGEGKSRLGYLWACGVPQGDGLFHWETSRAAACLDHLLPVDFRGTVQCDGYEAYDAFARRRSQTIVLAGCMAHVRRKFYDAREQAPQVAGWLLKQFAHLDHLEAQLRQARAGPDWRAAQRANLSRMVLARLQRALERLKSKHRYLPQSQMGKAIDYALRQWPALHIFLEDGRLEIGRVEDRRGGRRQEGVAVSGGFHQSTGASFSSVAPFPVPAPRTGRADFPHPALISEFPAFAFDWSSRLRGSLYRPSLS